MPFPALPKDVFWVFLSHHVFVPEGGGMGKRRKRKRKEGEGGRIKGECLLFQVTTDVRWTTNFVVRCDENDVCKKSLLGAQV